MSPQAKKPTKISHETHLKWKGHGEKEERSSFLILCEGKTEKGYFSGMRSRRGPQIDVDIAKGDHVSAVREAVSRVSDEYDEIWCVLDTELNATLATAMRREARKGDGRVRLGLSTPCFEFWLILHHADWAKPFQSADAAKKKLKNVLPSWNEGNTRFADFADGVDGACERAQKLAPGGEDEEGAPKNPSTGVWQLVESIQADSKQAGPESLCT
ncbi:RloB family protein [Streptosporangium roseum]|uniref:RloB family protein n=1 Tax=Streptosporangium roseum TaxID=2001 RepID=UPI00333267FB